MANKYDPTLGKLRQSDTVLPNTSTGIVLYNTADQTTNYERYRVFWETNVARISVEQGGSGTQRNLYMTAGGAQYTASQGATNIHSFIRSGNDTAARNVLRAAGTSTASSGLHVTLLADSTINQSGTAGYTAMLINPTETATGSGSKLLLDAQVGGVSQFKIRNDGVIFPKQAPTASAPTYTEGGIYYDTTAHKLMVGGASGWETVTSA